MRSIRNLLGFLLGVSLLGGIASALSALVAKRQLESRGTPTDDEVGLVSIYSGLDLVSQAAAFRGGSMLCWYGGGTLDLRAATLDPNDAHLTVRAIFGGARLVIPETWRVENRLRAVFGGVGDTRSVAMLASIAADAPTLVLDGFALFGGVAIVSDAPDLDAEGRPAAASA